MRDITLSRRDTFLGAAAASLAAAPARADIVAVPGLKRGYAEGPYGQIHYRIVKPARSNKTPLMCLHASPLSGAVYETWLQEIGKDRLAVAPDTPGYGGSDTPPAPLQIGDFADAMIRFMDEMKIKITDVFGYHTGSLTSVEIARKYPNRIRKVVTISAPNYTPEERAVAKARAGSPPPTFEQITSAVSFLNLVANGMCQRHLRHLGTVIRLLRHPIPESAAKPVYGQTGPHAAHHHQHRHI